MFKKTVFLFIFAFFLSACQNTETQTLTPPVPTTTTATSQSYQLQVSTTPIVVSPTINNNNSKKMSENITATIKTNKGTITVALFPKMAPNTVTNFVDLAKGIKLNPNTGKKVSEKPFYDGVIFHRVISGFMIQGGDPNGTGTGGPGYKFADEPVTEKYLRGTIAMANAGPNTNGSQFFIMHKDYPLPPNYTIFGRIDATDSASFATVDSIASVKTNPADAPLEKVVIESVTIAEK